MVILQAMKEWKAFTLKAINNCFNRCLKEDGPVFEMKIVIVKEFSVDSLAPATLEHDATLTQAGLQNLLNPAVRDFLTEIFPLQELGESVAGTTPSSSPDENNTQDKERSGSLDDKLKLGAFSPSIRKR